MNYRWQARRETRPGAARSLQAQIRVLEAENRRLRKLVVVDDLTNAFNRRHFQETFRSLLRVRPQGYSLALCLFDIDNFKTCNDAYGHLQGDRILREVAEAVTGALRRTSDRLFRLGGDEFGVLFWASSPVRALEAVNAMSQAIRLLEVPHAGAGHAGVTASFGVVWRDIQVSAQMDPQRMYAAADTALYEAKKSGRDCVRIRVL